MASIEAAYRSKLEKKVAAQLEDAGVSFGYETLRVPFIVPERKARYTPDFECGPVILEAKGYFRKTTDRQRLIQVKASNPDMDLRLVFQDANKPIYKGSKTTYGQWATDHGFLWADKGVVPEDWIKEIKKAKRKKGK